METESRLMAAAAYLPAVLQTAVIKMNGADAAQIQELRLRIGRNLHAVKCGREYAVMPNGQLASEPAEGISVTRQMMDTLFQNACMHSVHSCQTAIRSGFLTVNGGNRIGLCGSAVIQGHSLETVRMISSMNIRIASARTGCAEQLVRELILQNQPEGILIAGAPASGKTTLLRDIARILGNTQRVALMDERGELAAMKNGIPQFDIGQQTDVFEGYPKAEGIEIAARVMSPEWILCDELGQTDEADALLQAGLTGAHMIAAVHAGSLEELSEKPVTARLIQAGVFRKAVLLGSGIRCGQIVQTKILRRTSR